MRAAKQVAELANRSKSEFLANESHELRMPLNAIIGFSDTVWNEALGPLGNARYLEYIHDISHAGNHLLHLINDILDLSKIETGRSMLREEVVRLSYAIDSCTRIMKHRAEAKGIALNVDLEAVPTGQGRVPVRGCRYGYRHCTAESLKGPVVLRTAQWSAEPEIWRERASSVSVKITDGTAWRHAELMQ